MIAAQCPAVAAGTLAHGPHDLGVGPAADARLAVRRDVGRDDRRLLVQDVAGSECLRPGPGWIAVVERRMAPEAARNPLREVGPSRRRRGGRSFAAGARDEGEQRDDGVAQGQ
jgi:hypothetical protein